MNLNGRQFREYAGGSVGGILRKNNANANHTTAPATTYTVGEARQVDLLVFGYACKIFRDDDKARDIDQGKHLIPWMGDNSHKIDRYDVRGALCDLTPHEAPPGGYGNRLHYLNADEQRAEQLCEEERYLFLYTNEEELNLQQEEDLKRLKQESVGGGYSQVNFEYGSETGSGSSGVQHGPNHEDYRNSPTCEDSEQIYVAPKNFDVPASIKLPETMKHHAIIEKTARFIASQGVQMEILLKAKQSNNVQFEFLTQNSLLNPYYKFVLEAIKNGTYPVVEVPQQPLNDVVPNVIEESINLPEPTKPVVAVPIIKYKPSANCAYTQLISKIKGVPLPTVIDENTKTSAENSPSTSSTTNGGDFTPVLLQYNGATFVTADEDIVAANSNSNSNCTVNSQDTSPKVQVLKNSSALALAQGYSSDSESDTEQQSETNVEPKPEPVLNFPIPTENLRSMIDKTALYVIKNGRKFEETLRTKSEERFTFLIPENEFYPYYLYKVTADPDAASKEQKTRRAAAVAAALLSKKGLNVDKTLNTPVSFSIKSNETTQPLQPVLPQENSDDEDDDKKTTQSNQNRTVPEHVQKAIKLVESQLLARNAQLAATTGNPTVMPRTTPSRFDIDYLTVTNKTATAQAKNTKFENERNALFEQQLQSRQKELKKAEEKVKDKLAQIAREKLGGLLTKEKQIQLERKRKAMAFLNQIKDTPSTTVDEKATTASTNSKSDNDDSDVSEASVRSIPITSYGPDEKSDDEEELLNARIVGPQPQSVALKSIIKKNIIEKPVIKTPTVTLSDDDDDVQVISETRALPKDEKMFKTSHKLQKSRKRLSTSPDTYSRHKKKTKRESSSSSSNTSSDIEEDYVKKSKKHKLRKVKKSSSKKKSKNRSRSRSRSSHRHRSKSERRSRSTHKHASSRNSRSDSTSSERSNVSYRYVYDDKTTHKSSKRKESKRRHER